MGNPGSPSPCRNKHYWWQPCSATKPTSSSSREPQLVQATGNSTVMVQGWANQHKTLSHCQLIVGDNLSSFMRLKQRAGLIATSPLVITRKLALGNNTGYERGERWKEIKRAHHCSSQCSPCTSGLPVSQYIHLVYKFQLGFLLLIQPKAFCLVHPTTGQLSWNTVQHLKMHSDCLTVAYWVIKLHLLMVY